MRFQTVRYDLFSFVGFLLYISIFILLLPSLGLGSKSTSLSSEFYVDSPRHFNRILNLISEFFDFFWLSFWADGISKCGWYHAGGRGC